MRSSNNVMVFIEHHDSRVAEISKELLSRAAELARDLDGEVEAVVLAGDKVKDMEELGRYGCNRVYQVQDKRLAHFASVPYAKALAKVVKEYTPRVLLFGATTMGRDLAPRIASELNCGLTADCTELEIGSHKIKGKVYENILLQRRPAFGGNIIATIVSPQSKPSMATVREGVMKKQEVEDKPQVEVINVQSDLTDEDVLTEVLDIEKVEKKVDLKSAKIIVAAGMGAVEEKALNMVRELADVLGGEVGASRPVVDGGYLDKDHQVGQTGTTVRPVLYIACGISGQVQHRAGMGEAHRIIAINSDPRAPIFDCAHYAIVGDVKEVLPRMIQAYKEK
ncbi:MAG: electron transfer flavoprotein subunit alpha/FixB family protein [Thermodesulfobacteriota bacterium]